MLFEFIGVKFSIPIQKLAMAGFAAAATYYGYRSLPVPKVRGKMIKVFIAGELYTKKKGIMGKDVRILPTVRGVKLDSKKTEVVFTIPFGLDPEKVEKKLWLFRQQFGGQVELQQQGKKFILNAFHKPLSTFKYRFEEIRPQLDGKRLPILVGKTHSGIEAYDMVEHPHLLIAGETGSGKSTQLRAIIPTLIQAKAPHELHLYMADLKRSEFHLFRNVQHVQKVVTQAKDLYGVCSFLKAEMERRGDLLDQYEATHIDDLPPAQGAPYIILCIDEVALLKKEKKIMEIIEDISSIGRALGVFLILSMQRPDSEVLDGKLKQNLTVRMAFKHADEINSRITIGTGEAAHIKDSDKGRMYVKLNGLKLAQGAFLTLDDAKTLLQPFKRSEEVNSKPNDAIKNESNKIFGVLA